MSQGNNRKIEIYKRITISKDDTNVIFRYYKMSSEFTLYTHM